MKLKEELLHYLRDNIPLSSALNIQVSKCELDHVSISAPLQPNINHKKTAFGGSLHNVATFACWGLLWANLKEWDLPAEIVLSHSEINYFLPVTRDFIADCKLEDSHSLQEFKNIFLSKGKSRIILKAIIMNEDKLAVDYKGVFVAIRQKK
jgi:thioesterase domain-containing protein